METEQGMVLELYQEVLKSPNKSLSIINISSSL